MAGEALLDGCAPLPRDALIHHCKVHHAVARRRIVALGAILGPGRRMQVSRDLPRNDGMAVSALAAEERLMDVPKGMARIAV